MGWAKVEEGKGGIQVMEGHLILGGKYTVQYKDIVLNNCTPETYIVLLHNVTPINSANKKNRCSWSKWYHSWSRSNWHLWNTSSNNKHTHILLKLTWNYAKMDEILGHKAHLDKFKRTDNYKLCLQTIIDLNSKLVTDDS